MTVALHVCQTRNLVLPVVLLVICFLAPTVSAASGLLLYTRDSASYVNAVQYDTCTSVTAHITRLTVKGGKDSIQVRSDGIIADIPYPTLFSPDTQGDASKWIGMTELLATRYPQHARILQSVGNLWRQSLEASQVAQVPEPASPVPSTAPQKSIGILAPKSEIPLLQTKSGQTFKKVKITRFDGDQTVINHADGMGRVPLSDFGDLARLPADVKLAIEKAKVAAEEDKNRAAADKIEEQEKERVLKQEEADRMAKEKQAQDQQDERVANEKREKERLGIVARNLKTLQDTARNAKKPNTDESDSYIEHRGPSIHGFQLGMSYNDLRELVSKHFPSNIQTGNYPDYCKIPIGDLIGKPGATIVPSGFVVNEQHGNYGGVNLYRDGKCIGKVSVAFAALGNLGEVVYLSLQRPILTKLFNIDKMTYDDFCQSFIEHYGISQLKGQSKDGETKMQYESPDGWRIIFVSSRNQIQEVNLLAIPQSDIQGVTKHQPAPPHEDGPIPDSLFLKNEIARVKEVARINPRLQSMGDEVIEKICTDHLSTAQTMSGIMSPQDYRQSGGTQKIASRLVNEYLEFSAGPINWPTEK